MGGMTRTLSHLYDRNGNRFLIAHPDGTWFGTNYDGLDRPNVLHQAGSARIYYGYNDRGARNGAYGTNGATDFWEYDGVQRLGAHGSFHPSAHASADVIRLFGYNPAGQISSILRDNDAYAWTGAYNTARPYAANGLNQYSVAGPPNAAGSVAFTYDANGNLASETPWGGATTTYTYDIENRLVGRSGGVTLSYDPLGRLFEVSGATTTRFLYDGDALVAEYVSGAMTRRYVHNVGADVPMLSYQGSGLTQPSWLHADHQGSIVALSDAVGAATINTYDEYGIPGAGNSGRFQYTGQIWLDELGMYHYKARIYSPTLGRFLQTDPIGYEDQFNLYAYVGNDPINMIDSTGSRSTVIGNDIVIHPRDRSVPPVVIPRASTRAVGVRESDPTFHIYSEETRSAGTNLGIMGDSIGENPTPGRDRPATAGGTRNNVGPIPFNGSDNFVLSYRVPSPNRSRYTDIIVNYTITGEHGLEEGFVMRYGEKGDDGRITLRTYAEGNAGEQRPFLGGLWRPQVRRVWKGLDAETLEDYWQGRR